MTKYAFLDYIDDIKKEPLFYSNATKRAIIRMGNILTKTPHRLMDIGSQNIRYMNIFSDNIDEQLEKETEELHRAIYITFRNAKMQHLECLAAIHYISVMIQLAVFTFEQCCYDMKKTLKIDPTRLFNTYNLKPASEAWDKIVNSATVFFGYDKKGKHEENVDLNNPRCMKAIDAIRRKYSDIETLRTAMKKSYPWSVNYKEGIPYEESADNIIVGGSK